MVVKKGNIIKEANKERRKNLSKVGKIFDTAVRGEGKDGENKFNGLIFLAIILGGVAYYYVDDIYIALYMFVGTLIIRWVGQNSQKGYSIGVIDKDDTYEWGEKVETDWLGNIKTTNLEGKNKSEGRFK